MQRCLVPLVSYLDVKIFLCTKTGNCLNGVDCLRAVVILDLDEGVVKGHSATAVTHIHVNTFVEENLLSFKSGIGRRACHIDGKVEQVPSMMVDLVDFGTIGNKALDLAIVSSDQSNF